MARRTRAPKGNTTHAIEALQELGFAEIEAHAYVFLLQEPSATGYRVAQGVGKAAANVYKALDLLHEKGAVEIDDGEPRVYRAVPARELLASLRRGFDAAAGRAQAALSSLQEAPADTRLYSLATRTQTVERARTLCREARHVVLALVDPDLLHELGEDLVAAATRGVDVVIKTYGDATLPRVHMIHSSKSVAEYQKRAGRELSVAVDGEVHLQALLAWHDDASLTSLWSRNPMLALEAFNALSVELSFTELVGQLHAGVSREHMKRTVDAVRYAMDTPGYQRMLRPDNSHS